MLTEPLNVSVKVGGGVGATGVTGSSSHAVNDAASSQDDQHSNPSLHSFTLSCARWAYRVASVPIVRFEAIVNGSVVADTRTSYQRRSGM